MAEVADKNLATGMNPEVAATPELTLDTAAVLRSFVQERSTDKASLERLLQANPDEFCGAAVSMLADAESPLDSAILSIYC